MTAPGRAGDEIPLSILTGFLGSGKTTLLNVILSEHHGRRMGVVVNEFGQVDLDGRLIVAAREDVVELANGCVCCSARGNLAAALDRLLDRVPPVEYVLVEASGLAEPAPLAQAFLQPDLDPRLRLDGVVTVADARFLELSLAERPEPREQVAFADLVVLNKIDLVSAEQQASVEARLRALNPSARIVATCYGRVPIESLLDLRAFSTGQPGALERAVAASSAAHADGLMALTIREPRPLDLACFNSWLSELIPRLGRRLLRAKGVLAFAGDPERWIFQCVRDMVGVVPDRAWAAGEQRDSVLVFIGHALDPDRLQAGLTGCAVVDAGLPHPREAAPWLK
jgi:G3E family GTPase